MSEEQKGTKEVLNEFVPEERIVDKRKNKEKKIRFMGQKNLMIDGMENFKVRLFTNIPPNAVLVGHNIFTKNRKIYKKAFLHMPWFQSRYISLETKNNDLAPKTFELESGNLSVVVDAAISYSINPVEVGYKVGFKERWRSVIDSFKTRAVSSIVKTVGITVATVVSSIFFTPAMLLAVPAIAAGYISIFHQNQEWVNEQGAILAAYNSSAAMSELEQTIYDELRSYYASHNYEEVKGVKIDLTSPEFNSLRSALNHYSRQYGISVTKVNLKTVDLTPSSNEILQRQKEADVAAYESKKAADATFYEKQKKAEAQQFEYDRILNYVTQLREAGFNPDQITQILQTEMYAKSGATIITGNAGPVVPTVPLDGLRKDNQTSQGGRTR